jgi:LysR family transcriptional activator of glutamate synthase operon
MEFRQIEYFMEVAKREHMTDAANALHVAQSAVSRQIVNLEAELGVSLFIRDGRNIKVTPIGRTFLAHMEQVVSIIENAKREVSESLDPEKGTIRIGFPSSLAANMLPAVISAFREQHPLVRFHLNQGSYRYLIDSVINGEIDMALVGPLPKHEKKVKSEVLFIEPFMALLPTNHHLANKLSLSLTELQGESFILYPEGYILREVVVNACQRTGFEPVVSFEGKDIDAIKGLVAAGLGITLIPEITLVDSIPRSTVKIPVTDPSVTRNVGVVVPKERALMPTEQLFYEFLKTFFSHLNGFQL